jgi:hypothetical protein
MILLKIGDDGELHWNKDDILNYANLYDQGWRTDETEKAKLLQLIWESGYNAAIDHFNETGQRTMLLLSDVGGHA